jgi:hypothetical protein
MKVNPKSFKEYKGMGDFLGTGIIASWLRKYRSYKSAKKYAQSLNLKNLNEWKFHTKSKNFPNDIPVMKIKLIISKEWKRLG